MELALPAVSGRPVARTAAAGAPAYEDGAVRMFTLAAVLWGVVGMTVGVLIAAQLIWPELNFGVPWLTYGRLRPLHTNAVIFGSAVTRSWRPPAGANRSALTAIRAETDHGQQAQIKMRR